MFEKLGKKAALLPFVMAIGLCCLLGLAVAPMLRAEMSNVPFAIVNLDKGAVSVTGKVNVGETLTENMLSGEASLGSMGGSEEEGGDADSSSAMAGAIEWAQLSSEEELLDALADNEYYGGIVIPANFTSQQMSSATGLGSAPSLTIYLNKGKNPQVASSMQSTLNQAMLKAGIAADVEMVNTADVGGGSMGESMLAQMIVMPLFMMLMIGSILTSMLLWKNDVTGLRRKSPALMAVVMVCFIGVYTAFAAGLALCIVTLIGGMSVPVGAIYPVLWAAAFATMLGFVGALSACFPLGALATVATFALGMGTAMMPAEMLPVFWANWICPWAPQAVIGQTVRSIVYLGHVPALSTFIPTICFAVAGVVLLAVAALLSARSDKKPQQLETAEA